MKKIYALMVVLFITSTVFGAFFKEIPTTLTQPDGSEIQCYASGDEFFNWLHDEKGYTIIQGDDGYYYYGEQDGDFVKPSVYRVDSTDPETKNLEKWVKISKEAYLKKRDNFFKDADKGVRAPHFGTLNNISIYIKFNDQTEFTAPRSQFDTKFNDDSQGAYSMYNYYQEVSYNNLEIFTTHYPQCEMNTNLSYTDSHPRSYYTPYSASNPNGYQTEQQRTQREHTLLKNAVEALESEIPTDLDIDGDDDNYVDNVCFIIRGPNDNWADLLWAHRWMLYTYNVYIHGKQVYDYTFQPETQNNVTTLNHEMFHSLGAPDLYHYSSDGISPAGPWDLMEGGAGHMLAYMKYKYGDWISEIPLITEPGEYTLNPLLSDENNCYRINSPYSNNEYFVVEYRNALEGTTEENLPGSGLLVYRINTLAGDGNADGPPDEVYIYRPGGDLNTNGYIYSAHFSEEVGRTAINDSSDPNSFLTNGSPGGLNIYDIGSAQGTISFKYNSEGVYLPDCEITSPRNNSYLPNTFFTVTADASVYNSTIESVEFYIDDVLVSTVTEEPYEYYWDMSGIDFGEHEIKTAAIGNGETAVDSITVTIFDKYTDMWFSWISEEPDFVYEQMPAADFKYAVDFDFGENEFYAKSVRLHSGNENYDLSSLKIVKMGAVPTDIVLYDFGSFTLENQDWYEFDVEGELLLSGKFAIVAESAQNNYFIMDMNGAGGHSWFYIPGYMPWTNLDENTSYPIEFPIEIFLSGPRTLKGVVTNTSDEPIQNAEVKLFNQRNEELSTAYTDENGEYLLKTKDDGAYTVQCSEFFYYTAEEETEIIAGENVLDFELTEKPVVNLSGTVKNDSDTPIEADIKIYRRDTGEELYSLVSSLSDGNYAVDVIPYLYTFKITSPNHISFTKYTEISGDTTLNFVLQEPEGYFSDFEYDNGGLTASGPGWEWGTDVNFNAYSGDKMWGTILNGDYENGARYILDLPAADIEEDWILSFYHRYECQIYYSGYALDGGNVKISTDGGNEFSVLDNIYFDDADDVWTSEDDYFGTIMEYLGNPMEGELAFSGNSEGWKRVSFDLSDYAGENGIIRFDFASDPSNTTYTGWYIDQLYLGDKSVIMDIDEEETDIPSSFRVSQNYPNPFNPSTTIGFELPNSGLVSVRIYNIMGQLVKTLSDNKSYEAGKHSIMWNGKNNNGEEVPSGVYFYRITSGNETQTKKMLLIK